MTGDLVLYDSPGSPCARRVRIVLLEKGLPWTARVLDLTRLEQKSPAYLALNWVARVYDGTAVASDEAAHLESLLLQRLDRLDHALAGRDYLVGDRFTIADLSVL